MLRVLSLGAGVQSSTLLLMACRGDLALDCAIFADTQWEPAAVYRHLEWLRGEAERAGIPLRRVSRGNIREGCLGLYCTGRGTSRHVSMPYFTGGGGLARRQCTREYKVEPIERELRAMLGLRRGQRWPTGPTITQVYGISRDEAHRMRSPRRPCLLNEYPLIDRRMTRMDCLVWLQDHGYPRPPRSACIGCPFHSNQEWRNLTAAEFADACDFERQIHKSDRLQDMKHRVFLHRSLKPLDQVDLSPSGQEDLFGNECMGLCGN